MFIGTTADRSAGRREFIMKEIITKSSEETQKFAEDFAQKLKPGTVLLLIGELGAGKTTFVQGLAKGLGITERPNSPTFVVINEYQGNQRLVHIDLYRLENPDEISDLGLEEYFASDAIVVIEWGERLGELTPSGCVKIKIEAIGDAERKLEINN